MGVELKNNFTTRILITTGSSPISRTAILFFG